MAKSMETSKKLAYISDGSAVILSAAVVYGSICTSNDMTALADTAKAVWVECGVVNGFYFWKAKNENRSKHVLRLIRDFADKYGIDVVVQLADIILKD